MTIVWKPTKPRIPAAWLVRDKKNMWQIVNQLITSLSATSSPRLHETSPEKGLCNVAKECIMTFPKPHCSELSAGRYQPGGTPANDGRGQHETAQEPNEIQRPGPMLASLQRVQRSDSLNLNPKRARAFGYPPEMGSRRNDKSKAPPVRTLRPNHQRMLEALQMVSLAKMLGWTFNPLAWICGIGLSTTPRCWTRLYCAYLSSMAGLGRVWDRQTFCVGGRLPGMLPARCLPS